MASDIIGNNNLLWLTPDFLEPILFLEDGFKVKNMIYSSDSSEVEKGTNHLSSTHKVLIKCTKFSEDGPEEYDIGLFIKILPPELTERLKNLNSFSNEISMYRDTLKHLSTAISDVKEYCGIDMEFGPKYYYSENMPPYNLIIEDLSCNGFRMGNRKVGLDFKHCIQVVRTLAKFHAASIVVHSKQPKSIEKYNNHPFFDCCSVFTEPARRTFMYLADILEDSPEFDKTYSYKLRMYSDTIMGKLATLFTDDENKFRVLNHGDLWVNNIMFKYLGDCGEIQQVKLIDYQLPYYTSPALDLQYFIHTSPTEEVCSNHIDDLLREYHSVLCKTLTHVAIDGIGYGDFIKEYESKSLYGFFISIFILPVILADSEHAADLSKTPDENNVRRLNRLKNPLFLKVIKKLLPEFRNKNLI